MNGLKRVELKLKMYKDLRVLNNGSLSLQDYEEEKDWKAIKKELEAYYVIKNYANIYLDETKGSYYLYINGKPIIITKEEFEKLKEEL